MGDVQLMQQAYHGLNCSVFKLRRISNEGEGRGAGATLRPATRPQQTPPSC